MHDVVIVGGGHNGLIAAAFLARGGLKPLVLERADRQRIRLPIQDSRRLTSPESESSDQVMRRCDS